MEFITYPIIAMVVSGLFIYARKQIQQQEKNMNSQEFTMKIPSTFSIAMIASSGFMLSVGVYSCLMGTADDSFSVGLFMGGLGLVALFAAMCFNTTKVKVDQETIQSFNLFSKNPKVVRFSDIKSAKYKKTGNVEEVVVYNADKKKLFKADSALVGFSLFLSRVKELNCEFIEK